MDWAAAAATSGVLGVDPMRSGDQVLFMVGGALFLIPVLWGLVAGSGGRKDPVRLYSREDRQVGFKRAKGRCEMDGWFWMRCHRKAEHGDHWFHSRRGHIDGELRGRVRAMQFGEIEPVAGGGTALGLRGGAEAISREGSR